MLDPFSGGCHKLHGTNTIRSKSLGGAKVVFAFGWSAVYNISENIVGFKFIFWERIEKSLMLLKYL